MNSQNRHGETSRRAVVFENLAEDRRQITRVNGAHGSEILHPRQPHDPLPTAARR